MKKFKYLLIPLVLLAIVAGGFFWWRWLIGAVAPKLKIEKTFVIKKGENLSSVTERLEKEGLIRSPLAFKIFVSIQGSSVGKIQAGSFQLKPSLTVQEIVSIVSHGVTDVWLTFPEGWRREEFAQRLTSNLDNFNVQEFTNLTQDFEGELFPDTYLIPKNATPSAVIKILINNFQKKFNPELEKTAKNSGLTKKQVLILASLVEREVRHDEDRPIVAGILIKRWRKNWPLEIDATLQYLAANAKCQPQSVKCDWWPEVSVEDKQIASPYNTYRYKGLPPAPIANPGLASIRAVIYPQETDYWFYLSDLITGQIHYAKTLEEHQKNIEKYLR